MAKVDKELGYYFDLVTKEVRQGRRGSWQTRMGPYATREEAEQALERAAARNVVWDAEDDVWEDGSSQGTPPP